MEPSDTNVLRRLQAVLLHLKEQDARPELGLLGFPGRMRVPEKWEFQGVIPTEHLLYFTLRGRFEVRLQSGAHELAAGDLLWLEPGVAFAYNRLDSEPLEILRFRLRFPRMAEPRSAEEAQGRVFPDAIACRFWMEAILSEMTEAALWRAERIQALLVCLVSELARTVESLETPTGRSLFSVRQRERIHAYASGLNSSRGRPAELARHLGLSHDYFSRCFKQSFRMSPRRWLLEQRIRRAALRVVESDLRVGEIAEEFGYGDDVFLFSRQFKRILGVSPLEYRRSAYP